MDPTPQRCALCDQAVGGAAAACAVHGRLVCEACRGLVVAGAPRRVLPYAGPRPGRRRRWLLVVGAAVPLLVVVLMLVARNAAEQRARAAEMRAVAAEQQARMAALQAFQAAQQPLPATQSAK